MPGAIVLLRQEKRALSRYCRLQASPVARLRWYVGIRRRQAQAAKSKATSNQQELARGRVVGIRYFLVVEATTMAFENCDDKTVGRFK